MLNQFPSLHSGMKNSTANAGMKNNIELLEEKARVPAPGRGSSDYNAIVRSLSYALWRNETDQISFIDNMLYAIRRGFTMAWREGAGECGIKPEDMTQEEQDRLEQEIVLEHQFVFNFSNAIIEGSKANGGKWGPIQERVALWTNRYENVRNIAKTLACRDQKLIWIWNPLKEHCGDCAVLNGRVYRASVWQKYNIAPRSRNLACGGYRCGCSLEITDAPITPGRPPAISGA